MDGRKIHEVKKIDNTQDLSSLLNAIQQEIDLTQQFITNIKKKVSDLFGTDITPSALDKILSSKTEIEQTFYQLGSYMVIEDQILRQAIERLKDKYFKEASETKENCTASSSLTISATLFSTPTSSSQPALSGTGAEILPEPKNADSLRPL